jgi:hypothetical protein
MPIAATPDRSKNVLGSVLSVQLAMSTFKVPPVYAETLFRMLDATTVVEGLRVVDVLERHRWVFPGGAFGVRTTEVPDGVEAVDDTCNVVLPSGSTKDMAKAMVADAVAANPELDGDLVDFDPKPPPELGDILNARQKTRRTGAVEAKAWSSIFAYATEDGRDITTGMSAVYEMTQMVLASAHSSKVSLKAKGAHARCTTLARELAMGSSFGAELHSKSVSTNVGVAVNMMETYKVPALSQAESDCKTVFNVMARIHGSKDLEDFAEELYDLDAFFADDLDDLVDVPAFNQEDQRVLDVTVKVFPRCVVYRTRKECFVLGMSDWRKVMIIVTGFRNYIAGSCCDAASGSVAKVAAASRTVSAIYMSFREAVSAGANLAIGEHLDLAKAYKSLLAVVKARQAGERAEGHAADLVEDLRTMPIYRKVKVPVEAALERCSSLLPKGALAAAKLFRLLPPPDVWMASALRNRWEKASVVHNVPEDRLDAFEDALVEVILTSRCYDKSVKLELKNPKRRPVWWGKYISGDYDLVPKAELRRYVKCENTIDMIARSRYDPSVWKDSALGLDTFALAMMDKVDPDLKNMLTRMLFDDACPMPDATAAIMEELSAVMLKPESHKERIAYMNSLASRLRQSMTEATVGDTMKAHPSFAPVKTGVERDRIFEEMSKPPPSVARDPMDAEHAGDFWVTLFYSFDITGWSENMAANLQMRSHKVWDGFVGGTEFVDTAKNHHKTIVYMNNGGVKAWYRSGGANFEGYNGKEMTALHIAIMTLAVRKLRTDCPDIPPRMLKILLQAYIDDGVCRMTLPSKMCDRVFREWERVVSETWSSYGFTIEAKKSFPSYFYFEFLGEEFMAGRQLSSGTKAAMRITAEPFEYWETLPDRASKICAACRGASTAGMDSLAAVIIQSYFVSLEVSKWVDISDPTATAFWCLAPQTLGGLGVPQLVPQSCNASGAATEEAMAGIQAWAMSGTTPSVKRAYVALVKRGMASRVPVEVLSSPLGGKADAGVMTTNPLSHTVSQGLKRLADKGKLSTLGKDMVDLGDDAVQAEFANAVISLQLGDVYQEAALRDVSEATLEPIHRAFLSRFEKEGTFLRVAPRKKLVGIRKLAATQAKESHAAMALMAA